MGKLEVKELLEAGVHFGHLTRKWNPNMAPFIYMERNGIHIINLYKTVAKIDEASEALKKIAASGRKILFVATKKQAKEIVAESASKVNMPYITERWPGGMLTNFVTIRKAVKKMAAIDRMKKDGTFNTLSKKERLQVKLANKYDKEYIINTLKIPEEYVDGFMFYTAENNRFAEAMRVKNYTMATFILSELATKYRELQGF